MVAYITELNEENYDNFTKENLVLVDIWANWCNPCRVISPIIDQVSSDYVGKLSVGKLDADIARDLLTKLGVRNIPTLIIYKNGEIVERSTGMVTKEKVEELINNHLN
jgi:thioredoxin 1